MTISDWIAIASVMCVFLFSFIAYQAGRKKENKEDGENKGVIMSDIGYIKSGIDDLKREQRETNTSMSKLSERVTRCEERCEQAHSRIDEIKITKRAVKKEG